MLNQLIAEGNNYKTDENLEGKGLIFILFNWYSNENIQGHLSCIFFPAHIHIQDFNNDIKINNNKILVSK